MVSAIEALGSVYTPAVKRLLAVTIVVGVLVVAFLLPQFTQRRDTINLLFLVYLYVTMAQSWNMLAGFAGQVNLGHAAFFGVGALVTRKLWTEQDFPLLPAMLIGGLVVV